MRPGDSRGRAGIILVIVIALLLAGATRQWADQRRGERNLAVATPLSRMNSYALALLLGGLRGPLVMFLWPSSEGQKSDRNLEDFDTKVEWIRLLQAEFDTVHIFQIWNKAYNISVLMANLPNKYATILDALDYGHSVDAERPGNINILTAIAGIYGEKLATSAEKNYFKPRVREETMAREPLWRVTFPAGMREKFVDAAAQAGVAASRLLFTTDQVGDTVSTTLRQSVVENIRPQFSGEGITWTERQRQRVAGGGAGFRRTELDPMLDAEGRILPELVEPRVKVAEGNDGSELQYLRRFEPFPYGISAHALGYNYYKRAQQLYRVNNQHHAQLSDLVIDSRPALTLRNWSEDEWERGRLAELDAFGVPEPTPRDDRIPLEHPLRDLPLDSRPVNAAALREAIFNYDRAATLAEESMAEYELHLAEFSTNFITYRAHMDELRARIALLRGDRDYLKLVAGEDDRGELIRRAMEEYAEAVRGFQLQLINYYVEERQMEMFPEGFSRENADQLSQEQLDALAERLREDVIRLDQQSAHFDDWNEYFHYIRRAQSRLRLLESARPATAAAAER